MNAIYSTPPPILLILGFMLGILSLLACLAIATERMRRRVQNGTLQQWQQRAQQLEQAGNQLKAEFDKRQQEAENLKAKLATVEDGFKIVSAELAKAQSTDVVALNNQMKSDLETARQRCLVLEQRLAEKAA